MTIKSIDISNYTGFLTNEQIACLRDHGIQHVVVRAGLERGPQATPNPVIARQQMNMLTAAGIDWSVYLWVYPDWSPEQTVIDTVALLDGRPCRWFWLDVEELANPAGPEVQVPWLHRAIAECERQGKLPGIYTGKWYWEDPRYLNNSTQFRDIPLWTAQYDGNPDLNVWQRYGGWTKLFGKQYAGSGQQSLCGMFVDLNTFDDAVMTPAPPPEPPADDWHARYLGVINEVLEWQRDDEVGAQMRRERLYTLAEVKE